MILHVTNGITVCVWLTDDVMSTLVQVMAWTNVDFIITKVQWCSPKGNFAWDIIVTSH